MLANNTLQLRGQDSYGFPTGGPHALLERGTGRTTQDDKKEHYHGLFRQPCIYVLGIDPLRHYRVVNFRPQG